MKEPLEERFRRHVDEAGLLAGARTLLVAHSGGGDSTALLLLVSEWARPPGSARDWPPASLCLSRFAPWTCRPDGGRARASRPPPGASDTRLSSRSLTTSRTHRSSRATRVTTRPRRSSSTCLLYTSDAADEEDSVDLGGR